MAPPAYNLTALYPSNPNTERGASTKLHISKDNKLVYANGRTVIVRCFSLSLCSPDEEGLIPISLRVI